jgi:threonylcarbamoyladenosine tRNA methylthiotransferase MtaB
VPDCGSPTKYAVITFGCRVNQADSLGFEEELLARGAVPAEPAAADVVIVNTCSVTATADQGARQTIRRLARDNPAARIVVTGCYATRRPDEIRALPNVERVVSNDDKPMLLQIVAQGSSPAIAGLKACAPPETVSTAQRFGDGEGSCGAAIEPGVAGRTAFTLRVQTGCAEPCSYCIIPTTRGAPRSVPIEGVQREIARVAAAGFKEIALTGVHLGSYGRDLTPPVSLIDLLCALEKVRLTASAKATAVKKPDATYELARHPAPGTEHPAPGTDHPAPGTEHPAPGTEHPALSTQHPAPLFRISSLEPMDCTAEIVDLVARSDRFAPHFHLPLQHASNRMLEAMCRPYTIERYASLVDGIRRRIPHASIGSDIIVGFPGETDEDFAQLCRYLERSPLTHIHVFPYSDRPGTVAAAMRDKMPGAAVRERGRRIRDIGQRLTTRFWESQVGTTHRALTLEDGSVAVTGNYLKVRIPSGRVRNEWVDVRIASDRRGELLGG